MGETERINEGRKVESVGEGRERERKEKKEKGKYDSKEEKAWADFRSAFITWASIKGLVRRFRALGRLSLAPPIFNNGGYYQTC